MNSTDRLNLSKLVDQNNVADNTSDIRQKKHSKPIRNDVNTLIRLRSEHAYGLLGKTEYDDTCSVKCKFLFTYYTDIFNKIKKSEIDDLILFQLLNVLENIENGAEDQHSGAFEVGKILKKIYIDSAITRADNLDIENKKQSAQSAQSAQSVSIPEQISWSQYKVNNNTNNTNKETVVLTHDVITLKLVNSVSTPHILGMYENKPLLVKRGKWGKYLTWNEIGVNVGRIEWSNTTTIKTIVELITSDNSPSKIIRTITEDASVRNGKYGNYIYYKTKKMARPIFLNIKSSDINIVTCTDSDLIGWFEKTYDIYSSSSNNTFPNIK